MGGNPNELEFRELIRFHDGAVTVEDWELLMTWCLSRIPIALHFENVVDLRRTVEAVAERNVCKLKNNGQPIAIIKAVHTGANSARVMLTANVWIEAGRIDGAMGTVQSVCYQHGGPPALPLAVMVEFDAYSGLSLHNDSVPILPLRWRWFSTGVVCLRLQLPLRLAWAITIYKAQGPILEKLIIHVGKKEFVASLCCLFLSKTLGSICFCV